MIKSVTVVNYLGESLKMELTRPEESGFIIQYINGLGPVKADINNTEMSTGDGAVYNSARLNSRNIVFGLTFLPVPTIEHTRQKSYKYFPIKKPVKLLFETDNRICECTGYVESNEPDIFSSQESTQISIICSDPYLYSAGEDGLNITVFSGIEAVFEFPFSNESLTENLIEFGEIQNNTERTIVYHGDLEIGVTIHIYALGEASHITIYNSGTREMMRIDTDKLAKLTGSGIVSGDQLIITTVKNNKSIMLLRDGLYTNVLNILDRDADWFQLTKGDNVFVYVAETGMTNLQFRIENQTVYEGV